MKQFTFLQEGSNRILSKSKNPSGLVLMQIVGTRPLARDWTVAWGVAGDSTTRPEQRDKKAI